MNKLEYFIVGCFLTGGLCFVTPFVFGSFFPVDIGAGAAVVLIIVGTPFLIISFLTFLLVPNTITGTKSVVK